MVNASESNSEQALAPRIWYWNPLWPPARHSILLYLSYCDLTSDCTSTDLQELRINTILTGGKWDPTQLSSACVDFFLLNSMPAKMWPLFRQVLIDVANKNVFGCTNCLLSLVCECELCVYRRWQYKNVCVLSYKRPLTWCFKLTWIFGICSP